METKKQIWFYDNDDKNKTASDKINFIKVRDGGKRITASMKGVVSCYFKERIPDLSKDEFTDEYSGIQEDEFSNLVRAVEEGLVSAVVFDWDRTLTKVEGLYKPPTPVSTVSEYKTKLNERFPSQFKNFVKLTDKEIVDYFFHNHDDISYEERSAKIGALLGFLNSNNIPVFVLTNSLIGYESPGLMSDMLTILADGVVAVPEENVFYNIVGCGYRSPYISGKEQIIIETILPMVESIQPPPEEEDVYEHPTLDEVTEALTQRMGTLMGGGIKRKTRKQRKKKRKTRKRKRRKTKHYRKGKKHLSKTRKLNV